MFPNHAIISLVKTMNIPVGTFETHTLKVKKDDDATQNEDKPKQLPKGCSNAKALSGSNILFRCTEDFQVLSETTEIAWLSFPSLCFILNFNTLAFSCLKILINSNFYFCSLKWIHKQFAEQNIIIDICFQHFRSQVMAWIGKKMLLNRKSSKINSFGYAF